MATQKRGVSNAVTSKSFQPKYNDCSSIWGLKHLESFQNNYFLTLADHFKQERTVSLVLTDGISIFRPEAWKSLVISKDSSAIIFDAAFVLKENQNIDPVMQIKVDANVTQNLHVGIWWNQPGNGFYVTSSPSRGLTTVGQGAVDFLTASAIFADAIRNVFFDESKSPLSLEILRLFARFREQTINPPKDTESVLQTIRELGDALYMSAAYRSTENGYERNRLETIFSPELSANEVFTKGVERWGKRDLEIIFEPDQLKNVLKAYA